MDAVAACDQRQRYDAVTRRARDRRDGIRGAGVVGGKLGHAGRADTGAQGYQVLDELRIGRVIRAERDHRPLNRRTTQERANRLGGRGTNPRMHRALQPLGHQGVSGAAGRAIADDEAERQHQ